MMAVEGMALEDCIIEVGDGVAVDSGEGESAGPEAWGKGDDEPGAVASVDDADKEDAEVAAEGDDSVIAVPATVAVGEAPLLVAPMGLESEQIATVERLVS